MTGQQQSTGKQEAAGHQALHGAAWRYRRRQEDRTHHQGRWRGSRQHQADRAGTDRQRQGERSSPASASRRRRSRSRRSRRNSKTPEIVTAAGTSIITEKSPYIARTSFTLAQSTVPMADWAADNGIKKVVTMISDYAPGMDAEKSFIGRVQEEGRRGSGSRSASRWPIRISRRSCNAPPTRSRMRFSSSFRPGRAALSSSNSSSAASTRPASRSSAPAT